MVTAVDPAPRQQRTSQGVSSRAVRVCFLIDELGKGGTETQLLALIRHLDRTLVSPYLCLLRGEGSWSRALEPSDCPVLRLDVRRLLRPRCAAEMLRFARFLRRERIDVLQPYFADSTYFGVLAGRLAGVRTIVRTRNNINHWMTPIHRRLGRLLNRSVTVTLCNSEAARQAVLADERPHPHSVIVIENGVDLERFAHIAPPRPDGARRGARRVGMVANLRPVKGVDVFARAAARVAASCPDVTFHVAGEGPHRPELERLIAEMGLSGRFTLHGRVDDIPAFLADLDLAVLSSHAEGLPNAVLEYMAAARPIVATAVGGVPSVVSHGVHAWLVQPGSPDSLAGASIVLLKDPGKAARLASEARRRAECDFSRRAMVRRVESFYIGFDRGNTGTNAAVRSSSESRSPADSGDRAARLTRSAQPDPDAGQS
jgi:glycosyltransferase involved in cell wall biosynthesis